MGGGPPAGAQRVDVPDDNSILLMPTTVRTAAVTRWVGRGNGPSRVTGANACPAAGDCYKNNYPHRTLGAARLNTAQRRLSTAQRMTRRRVSRIRSGFTARRAAKDATGRSRLQLSMNSGSRKVRQTPAQDRTSPTWQLMAHQHCGHWTAGRTRKARWSLAVDDSQRGPTENGTVHNLLLGHITDFRGGSVARRKRCRFDIGLRAMVFLLSGPTPKENWEKKLRKTERQLFADESRTGRSGVSKSFARIYARITDDRTTHCFNVGPSDHPASFKSCKGRRTLRAWRVRDGQDRGFYINRFTPRHLQQQGVLGISVCLSAGNACDDASGWYWRADRHKAGVGTQRTRNRSKGTVRTTCWHLGAFHASLSANRGRTPGSSELSRGHYCRTRRTQHRSRGTAQTTFWHLGALHVSLAGNRDRTLVNCLLSPLGNLACDTSTRATYLFLDHLRHGNQSRMSTLGTHDKPLRGRGPVLLALWSVGCYVDKT